MSRRIPIEICIEWWIIEYADAENDVDTDIKGYFETWQRCRIAIADADIESNIGGWAVPAAFVNHSGEGAGLVSLGQGGSDHPCSEGGSWKEGGGHEAGGGDEEGEEGPVDGVPVGAGLGQKRQLSYWCLRWSLEMKPWYKFMLSNLCFASLLQMCIHSVRPSFSILSTILSTIWIYWWIVVVFCWVNCSIMRSRTWNKCLKKKINLN